MTIGCENISFSYGEKLVLDDISIQFEKGYLYGVLGPNGSGKTTFLKVLNGVLKSKYGKVKVDDKNIKKLTTREIAKKIAMVPQSTLINFDFFVKDIVMMGRYAHIGRFSRESNEDRKIVNEILRNLGLVELKNRSFKELSGGEQQKTIIARALAQQSKIILLDEPTTHLDINYQIELMELLKKYVKDGLIVIIVLHDINIATQFCDKIILIHQGEIKALGNVENTITKDNIKSIYNVDVIIRKNIFTNSIYVNPIREKGAFSLQPSEGTDLENIHVIAGGGSALEILPALKGYNVSVGVLNVLDDDFILANELNYNIISEAPFSPISEESSEKLRDLLKNVDLIILADFPFGKYNLENLLILDETDKEIIVIERNPIEERDFTDGFASKIYNKIKTKKNVKVIKNFQELCDFSLDYKR